nr:tyrosine-type recombinase/integrase [uncultured Undibacterium sp.]
MDEIEPQHISQYLDWRRDAPIQANREKALFSTLFNHARSWGMTRSTNPCMGVKGFKETGRQIYIEDEVYDLVIANADSVLRRYMNLLYLTAQRSTDIFSMSVHDLSEAAIAFEQSKTRQKIRMNLKNNEGQEYELGALMNELMGLRKNTKAKVEQLFIDEDGDEVTYSMMSQRFRRLRKKLVAQLKSNGNERMAAAIAEFQLRDLRGKAGTDTAIASGDIRTAQKQLGHKNLAMTEHYIKNRRGDRVNPTK